MYIFNLISDLRVHIEKVRAKLLNNIGQINEQSLHAALKRIYAHPKGLTEVSVGGFVVDVLNDRQIIEIQTGKADS